MDKQFERIKKNYQNKVYSFAYYSLRSKEDAEDITQECFIRLWNNWHKVDKQRINAWLMRVTRNLVVDYTRKSDYCFSPAENTVETLATKITLLDNELMQTIIVESIRTLNEPYRTTMILREIQGFNYFDLAEILGMSINQVKTNLYRGKRKLRDLVKQHRLYSEELLHEEIPK